MAPSRSIVTLRSAPLPRVAGGEGDRVGAVDGGYDFIDAGLLKVAEHRGSSSAPDLGSMVRVADQSNHVVAPGRQQGREVKGNLAVSASDCDLQVGLLLRVWPIVEASCLCTSCTPRRSTPRRGARNRQPPPPRQSDRHRAAGRHCSAWCRPRTGCWTMARGRRALQRGPALGSESTAEILAPPCSVPGSAERNVPTLRTGPGRKRSRSPRAPRALWPAVPRLRQPR